MTELLLYTFIYLAFAVGAVLLSQKLGLGSVLGYLMAGIVIGPALGLVGKETESIQHVAEFGVVMMLFLVGLELAPQMLWQLRHKLLGLGGLQVGLTLAAITAAAIALGYPWQAGIALGCVLALSSTAIVLQTLGEKGLMQTPGGQAGFAVLLFQDVAAIPMLALLPLLASAPSAEAGHDSLNLLEGSPGWTVALVSVAAIGLIVAAVHYLVPFVLRFIIKSRVREMLTVFTLALVVGIATLMSLIGLSPALGAFIAGVTLANSHYRHELESQLEPFKGLLLGLFFITVGAGMNFVLLGRELGVIVGLTLGLLLLKGVILWLLGKLFRLPPLGAKLLAFSLAQAGEFGFVLLSISRQSKVLPPALADRISLVVALSMLLTPLLFIVYDKIMAPRAIKTENHQAREADQIEEENPAVVLGHGRFGRQINSMLTACGIHTTVIDNHAEMVEGLTKFGIKTYYGDATRPEMLTSIGLGKAKLAVVAVDRTHAVEIVEFIRRHYPDLPVIARAYDRPHAYELHHAGAHYIIRETHDAAMRSARIALERLGLSPEQARKVSKFYAARDRDLSDKMAEAYDPKLSVFVNEEMQRIYKDSEAETRDMISRLLRGEEVDWQENPNSWTRVKKGIS